MKVEELVNALYDKDADNDIYLVIYDSNNDRLCGFFLGSLYDEYNSLYKNSVILSEDLIGESMLKIIIDKDPRKESDLPHSVIFNKNKK